MNINLQEQYKKRIDQLSLASSATMSLILLISFSFILFVGAFDYVYDNRPKIIEEFTDTGWRTRQYVSGTENRIQSLIQLAKKEQNLPLAGGITNNLEGLQEELKATVSQMADLEKKLLSQQSVIFDNYMSSKRILLGFASLFMLVIVKLLIDLYRYTTHMRAHYLAIQDALIIGNADNQFDMDKTTKAFQILAPKDIRISHTKSNFDELIQVMENIRKKQDKA